MHSSLNLLFLRFPQLPCYSLLFVSLALPLDFSSTFCYFSCHYLCLTRLRCTPPLCSLSNPLTPLVSSLNFARFLCLSVMYILMPLRLASSAWLDNKTVELFVCVWRGVEKVREEGGKSDKVTNENPLFWDVETIDRE